ncbi:hypothetical protein R5R35_010897 [Gryllus longicercus]|uniref:Activin types I and II receptor domain-containing protein n=1 Tax=Gryllus longicercus TaxID=2509291 RepID=A0AAN9Z0K7_9ORTH
MLAGALLAVAAAALLAPAPLAARVRQIQCACSPGCPHDTCTTEYQCYTQYMHDELKPLAYGCLRRSRNNLLCENKVPNIPTVICCDTDFCNRRTPSTTMPSSSLEMPSEIPPNILSHILAEAKSTNKPDFTSKLYPLDKPMVLSALFVGLFFLLAILWFGFYLLHKQSRTVKRLWKNRSQGEMTLSLMDVPSTC